ncbi:MAG: glycosyltransferase family 2 protein [Chloroflexota bacterium]|nr:MAG: glycosyltransferase family 2 protein [Chloroflexota bacterium]
MAESNAGGQAHSMEGPVSVVVPTYNRADRLETVLGSYLSQSRIKEVIVVDNGSVDRTPELLMEWSSRVAHLRIVRLSINKRQAGARNAGAEAARGEYVFYGEDDYELTPGQIAILLDHLEQSGADMIAGRRINVLPGESYQAALRRIDRYVDPLIERWAMVGNHHLDTRVDVEAPLLDACALIRREVFRHVSFDLAFKGNGWREESDFQLGAREAGFRLVHCPHTLGFHSPGGVNKAQGGSRSRGRLNYELWVVKNNARFLRKHWAYLRSERSELRVAPVLELAVAVQTILRGLRAGRKLSRVAGHRTDRSISPRWS